MGEARSLRRAEVRWDVWGEVGDGLSWKVCEVLGLKGRIRDYDECHMMKFEREAKWKPR
jgi:hypothetical protein